MLISFNLVLIAFTYFDFYFTFENSQLLLHNFLCNHITCDVHMHDGLYDARMMMCRLAEWVAFLLYGGNGNGRNVSCSKPSLHCHERPREEHYING